MIELQAYVREDSPSEIVDWRSLSETDLLYYYFVGDIYLKVEGADLSAPWGWVPVIDFALNLQYAMKVLRQGSSAELKFTESEHVIRFRRSAGLLEVSATYTSATASTSFREFDQYVANFVPQVRTMIVERAPEMEHNIAFLRLFFERAGE